MLESSKNREPMISSDEDENNEEEFDYHETTTTTDQENSSDHQAPPLVEVLQSYSPIACRECRKGHRKCDKTLPICSNCRRKDKVCVYPQAKRNRKAKSPTKTLVPVSNAPSSSSSSGTITTTENNNNNTTTAPLVAAEKTEKHGHTKKPQEKHGVKHGHDEEISESEEEDGAEPVIVSDTNLHRDEHQPAHKRIELLQQIDKSPFDDIKTVTYESVLSMFVNEILSLIQPRPMAKRKIELVRDLCLYDTLISFHLMTNEIGTINDDVGGENILKTYTISILCHLYELDNMEEKQMPHMAQVKHHDQHYYHHKKPNALHIATSFPQALDSTIDLTPLSLSTPTPELAHLIGHDSSHFHHIAIRSREQNIPEIDIVDLSLVLCIQSLAFDRVGLHQISQILIQKAKSNLEPFFLHLKAKKHVKSHNHNILIRVLICFSYISIVEANRNHEEASKYISKVSSYLESTVAKHDTTTTSIHSHHGWKEYRNTIKDLGIEDHLLHLLLSHVQIILFSKKIKNKFTPSQVQEFLACLNELHSSTIVSQFNILGKLQNFKDSTDITEFLIKTLKQKKTIERPFPRSPQADELLYEYSYLHIHEEDELRIRSIENETSFWVENYLTIPCKSILLKQSSTISCSESQKGVSFDECLERMKLSKEFLEYGNQILKNFISPLSANISLLTSMMIVDTISIVVSKLSMVGEDLCSSKTTTEKFSTLPNINTPTSILASYSVIEATRNDAFYFSGPLVLPCIVKAVEVQLEELETLQSTALMSGVFGLYGSQESLFGSSVDDLSVLGLSEVPNHTINRIRQYLKWGLEAIVACEQSNGVLDVFDLKESVRKIVAEEEFQRQKDLDFSIPSYYLNSNNNNNPSNATAAQYPPITPETTETNESFPPLSATTSTTDNIMQYPVLISNHQQQQQQQNNQVYFEVNPQENNEL